LQSQEGFLESLIEFQTRELNFKPYGFATLAVNQEKLVFQVDTATGLMPDGLPFDIPASDKPAAGPLSIVMNPEVFGERKEMDLFLAIPFYQSGQLAVSLTGYSATARYVAHLQDDVVDETSGGNPKPIQVARKNFRLLFETQTEELRGCSAMRIARILRVGDRAYRIDEKAPPPLLRLQASNHLNDMLRGLINALARRASELGKSRRPKGESQAEFTALDTAAFWLLHTLNASIPVLKEFCEIEQRGGTGFREPESHLQAGMAESVFAEAAVTGVHPVNVYRELASLAGALLTFRLNDVRIPAYDHDDPGACFGELISMTRRLLDEAIPRTYDSRVLRARAEPNQFSTPVPDEWFRHETGWYLAITSTLNDSAWSDQLSMLEKSIKIASVKDLSGLVRKATLGVEFTFDSAPPQALPAKTARHFQLRTEGSYWEGVRLTRSLAVYLPKEARAERVELVVLLPPETQGRKI
jgi:type VI secretion system protein ImpJ